MQRDFVNTTLMATAFEICLEERTHDVQCFRRRDKIGRQAEYIRIVMLSREFRKFGFPAQRGADSLMLVCRHGNAVAGGANNNTELELALLHRVSERMCEIRIVTTLGIKATEVLHFSPVVLKEQLYLLFERKPRMIAGKRNGHF